MAEDRKVKPENESAKPKIQTRSRFVPPADQQGPEVGQYSQHPRTGVWGKRTL